MGKWNIHLEGNKFGRWTVIERVDNRNGYHYWLCKCECGTQREVDGRSLTSGLSTSCGCFKSENTSKIFRTHGKSGNGRHSEYGIWGLMIQRCTNPNVKCYAMYGAKGVLVCERWLKFENFYEDIGPRPSPNHSIDRYPNNKGNYEPGNVRWATAKEQLRNFSRNRWFEYKGERMILKDWADKWGVHPASILGHINRGKTFVEIFNYYEKKQSATDKS